MLKSTDRVEAFKYSVAVPTDDIDPVIIIVPSRLFRQLLAFILTSAISIGATLLRPELFWLFEVSIILFPPNHLNRMRFAIGLARRCVNIFLSLTVKLREHRIPTQTYEGFSTGLSPLLLAPLKFPAKHCVSGTVLARRAAQDYGDHPHEQISVHVHNRLLLHGGITTQCYQRPDKIASAETARNPDYRVYDAANSSNPEAYIEEPAFASFRLIHHRTATPVTAVRAED